MKFRKRIKRLIITTGLLVTLGIGMGAGGMTAYAAGPGEVNQTTTATQETQGQTEQGATAIISYAQAQVPALGTWEAQADGSYKFMQFTGSYLTNAWVESVTTQGTWYFLDSTGIMLRSTTTPDNFYVDQNGEYHAPLTSNTHSTGSSTDNSSTSTPDTPSQAPTDSTTEHKYRSGYYYNKEHSSKGSSVDPNANKDLNLQG